jgi:RND superfamily putative drug exporter
MQTSATQRLATACATHRWRTIGGWLAVLVLALAANALFLGSALTTEGNMTTEPDSVKGFDLLDERFPGRDAATELVVVRSESVTVDDPAFRTRVADLRREIAGAKRCSTSRTRSGPAGSSWCRATAQPSCYRS